MDWLGWLINLVALGVTIYLYYRSSVQLRRAVRTVFERDLRKTINRIERNKEQFKDSVPTAYKELFDIQDELEVFSKKFPEMFEIK